MLGRLAMVTATMILLGLAAGAQPAAAMFTGVVKVAKASTASSADKVATARCPAGKVVTGAGGEVTPPDGRVLIDDIRPSTTLTSVTVSAYEDEAGTAENWTVTAHAICSLPPAGLQLVKATSTSSSASKSATATCPTGKKVLGTGGEVSGAPGQLLINGVTPSADLAKVSVSGFEDETGTTAGWTVTAYAICGSPAQPLVRRNRVSAYSSGTPRYISRECEVGEVAIGMGGALTGAGNQLVLQAIHTGPIYTIEPGVIAAEDRTGYAGTWTPEAFVICGAALGAYYQQGTSTIAPHHWIELGCGTDLVALGSGAGTDGGRGETWLSTFGPQTDGQSVTVGWSSYTSRQAQIAAHAFCATAPAGYERALTSLPEERPDDPIKSAVAACPAGTKVLSGGSSFLTAPRDPDVMLQSVVPSADLASVRVVAAETEGGSFDDWDVWATAVCAAPPPGLQRVSRASASDSSESKTVTISCPAGKHLVGAGAHVAPQFGEVVLDDILPNRPELTTVTVEAFEDVSGFDRNWSLTAYGVCITR